MRLARRIQHQPPIGWGQFQDVAERTLTQQLSRLRIAAAEGAFGPEIAKELVKGHTPQIKMLEHVSVRVLERLEELSEIQRNRVLELVAKEKVAILPAIQGKLPAQEYRHLLTQTNLVFSDYRQVLLDLQKIRFDLGLDEFKGPLPTATVRGASQTTTFPDGMSVQKQVFEAVATVEQILDKRKIPLPGR